jgi:hypothetical protein
MVQGLCANTISVEDASSSSGQRLNFFAQELVLDLAQALGTCPMCINTAGDVDKSGHGGLQGCERASIQSFSCSWTISRKDHSVSQRQTLRSPDCDLARFGLTHRQTSPGRGSKKL